MVEGRVFLSILVDEWYLTPECWLSLSLVNSSLPLSLSPFAETFVSQPALKPVTFVSSVVMIQELPFGNP